MKLGQWIGLIVLLISLYVLWEIRQVLLLLFASVLLATALNKLVRRLQKVGKGQIARTTGVILAIAIFFAVLVGFFLLIVPPFANQFQELTTTKLPQISQLLDNWRQQLTSHLPAQVVQYLPDVDSLNAQLQPLLNGLVGRSFAFVSSSLGIILNILLFLVWTIMLLVQPLSYRKAFVRLFPSFYRRRVEGILDECEIALGRWFIGALISMSVVALLSVLGLTFLQIPLALAQGVLAGLLNFVPNIGPTLSVVLPMAIALLDAPWKSVAVLILYLAIQQFESNILTPYVMAQQLSLLPAVTLLSQLFFATFFGFLGFLLAIPLTVVGQVWLKEVLIKDVLDQWKTEAGTETELVIVSDSIAVIESNLIETRTTNESPRYDDVSKSVSQSEE